MVCGLFYESLENIPQYWLRWVYRSSEYHNFRVNTVKTQQKLLNKLASQINSDKCCNRKAKNIRKCLHTHTHTQYTNIHTHTHRAHMHTQYTDRHTHSHILTHTCTPTYTSFSHYEFEETLMKLVFHTVIGLSLRMEILEDRKAHYHPYFTGIKGEIEFH